MIRLKMDATFTADGERIMRALYSQNGLNSAMRSLGNELVSNARSGLMAAGTDEARQAASSENLAYKGPTNGPGINTASYPVNKLYRRVVRSDKNPSLGNVTYRTGLVVSNHPASQFLEVGSSRRTPLKFMQGALQKSSAKNVAASGQPGSTNEVNRWIYKNAIKRNGSTKKGRK